MLNGPIISRLFADVSKYSSKVELFKNGAHLKEVFVLVAHAIKNFTDNHGHNILRLFFMFDQMRNLLLSKYSCH